MDFGLAPYVKTFRQIAEISVYLTVITFDEHVKSHHLLNTRYWRFQEIGRILGRKELTH